MIFEPGMFAPAPAQVFLHDAMHDRFILWLELKRHGQCDITALVERARVVAELHVVAVDRTAVPFLHQQLG